MTRFVAVGEIGLDYHYGKETAELQKKVLRTQLELASEWDLPVNIHLREAEGDFFDIISDCDHLHLRGNLHAFSASAEFFRQVSRHGDWRVGVGGVLTFKKARIAREILEIPLDRILLETDAPYLTPTPLGDIALAVLVGIEGPGVNVDVGVELLDGHSEAPGEK